MTRPRPDRLRLAAALAVSLALASSASAQPQRDVHHIRIQEQGGQCVYRIAEQEQQDVFVVPPSGKVIFQPLRGVKATAVITSAEDGAPGTRGANVVVLGQRGPRSLDVRKALGRDTEHQVNIECCMERQGNDCSRWQDAVAATDDIGLRSGTVPDVHRSGPSASEADPTPTSGTATGGPKMEVVE